VEDIFADWKVNLSKKRVNRKPRTRKISHREQRKEVLKSADEVASRTYAQAVQKNLRKTEQPVVEDVFESFAYLFDQESTADDKPEPIPETIPDIRHMFHVPKQSVEDLEILDSTNCLPSLDTFKCGEPTVKTIPKKKGPKHALEAKVTMNAAEAKKAWKESPKAPKTKKPIKKGGKAAERDTCKTEIVPTWEKMLAPETISKPLILEQFKVEYKSESIFAEWIQNFDEPKPMRLKTQQVNPAVSPKVSPKAEKKKTKTVTTSIMEEEIVQDFKADRRTDFLKVTKIKDKKRTQAERRSKGRKTKEKINKKEDQVEGLDI